jgi:membrane-associated phospholipid phosphatase
MIEYISRLDQMMVLFVNTFVHKSYVVDRTIDTVTSIDLLEGVVFIAIMWWIWFSKKCPPRLGAEGNRMLVVRSIIGGLVATGLGRCLQQLMPQRPRPVHEPGLGLQLPYGVKPETLMGWGSFPSDHAVLFFALATAIWLWSRAWGAVAFLWALAVCMPRIYMGYHYPSDIIIGALLGIAVMLVVQNIPLPSSTFAAIRRYETGHPAAFYTLAFVLSYQISTLFLDVRRLGSGALVVLGLGK